MKEDKPELNDSSWPDVNSECDPLPASFLRRKRLQTDDVIESDSSTSDRSVPH